MMQDFSFVHKYFIAEKQAGLLFLILGGIAILVAILFLFAVKTNPSFFKGMALPLFLIGVLQVVVGVSIFSRSDKQRMDVSYKLGMDPSFVKTTEQPRMEKVQRNFSFFKYAEVALLIAGIVLIVLYRTNADKSFWYGLGLALVIQSIICFSADVIAANRAAVYLNALKGRG